MTPWWRNHRLWLSALALWLCTLLAGLLASLPLMAVLEGALASHPHATEQLLQPGGEYLIELWRLHGPALGAALRMGLWELAALGLLTLLPQSALRRALAIPGERTDCWLTNSFRIVPGQGLLWLLTRLSQGLCVAFGMLVGASASAWVNSDTAERTSDLLFLSGTLLGLGLACTCQILGDLARARHALDGLLSNPAQLLAGPLPWRRSIPLWLGLYTLRGAALFALNQLDDSTTELTLRLLAIHQVPLLASIAAQWVWMAHCATLASSAADHSVELSYPTS